MRYGYWLPVFWRVAAKCRTGETWRRRGSTLPKWPVRAEQIGYDLCLVAELNLNDIKGMDAPALDAWSTAAALAAVTKTQEIMIAVRPTFHSPRPARKAGRQH